jgi:hypothetical protein
VVQATRGSDDAQQVDMLAGTSTSASPLGPTTTHTGAPGTTAEAAIDPDATAIDGTTTTALVPVTPPPTSAPGSDVIDFGAPGVPWLVLEDGRVLGSRTGGPLLFAGASNGWLSEDLEVSVIQRFTDTMYPPVPVDDTMRPLGDGRYLTVKPEAGGWTVMVYAPDGSGAGLTRSGEDGGFHVSGTDADMAADLVGTVLGDESDIPATLQAGSRTLTLVVPTYTAELPSQKEGGAVTYGIDDRSNIEISVTRAGQYGWRGEVIASLAFGGPTGMSSVVIGGQSAWVADLAREGGTAASVIAWQPNAESVVVIHAEGIDAATLKTIVQNRLHRVTEAAWHELTVAPTS